MRECLKSYDILYFMAAVSILSLVMKMIASLLYRRLLWDSNQMGTTDNRWMKSMMSKFEAYYKLRISVHNVENFVDRYLYHYRFLGLSLHAWEYAGEYFMAAQVGFLALFCMLGGYYRMSVEWFSILGGVTIGLLLLQGMFELCFNTHQGWRIFRIQVIDYMENTMRARLENEYFHQEATRKYRMEYFEEPAEKQTGQNIDAAPAQEAVAASQEMEADWPVTGAAPVVAAQEDEPAGRENVPVAGQEMAELLSTLFEEMQLDRDIARKQQALSEQAAAERAELFEEVLREIY